MTGDQSPRSPRSPRRQPRQSRSRELVRAIREAGLAILEEEGATALTTNRIAERAGVGIASLYRYYPDKQAILADIFEERVRAIDALYRDNLARQPLASLSLLEQLRYLIETPIALSLQLLHLHRDFFQAHHLAFEISYRRSPDGERSWAEWAEDWWERALVQRRDELTVADPALAAKVVLMAARGAIDAAIERDPALLENPAFGDSLVAMAAAYLAGRR